jgi:hypothetical protein
MRKKLTYMVAILALGAVTTVVAEAPGADLARYQTIVMGDVSFTPPAGWRDEDRAIASSVAQHLRAQLAQKLRATGEFAQMMDGTSMTEAPRNALRLDVRIADIELDKMENSAYSEWTGPGSIMIETSFVDLDSGRVVLATMDRRTAQQVFTQTRDVPGTTQLLDKAADSLVRDLVSFLRRSGITVGKV